MDPVVAPLAIPLDTVVVESHIASRVPVEVSLNKPISPSSYDQSPDGKKSRYMGRGLQKLGHYENWFDQFSKFRRISQIFAKLWNTDYY